MKTFAALLLLLFLVVTESSGQIRYEKGYFINNDNQRIECLIRNMNWKYNPVNFSYKLDHSAVSKKGDLTSVKEFGIYNYYKFVGADVKIDRSINPTTHISYEKDPIWKQEKLFLKVLLEGKANLYCYESKNLKKFFYSVEDGSISQLVYKEYQEGTALIKNTSYWQQLWGTLKYPESTMELIKNVNYNTKDLESYFKTYNRSYGDTITEIVNQAKSSYLNLKLTPGVNFASGSISLPGDQRLNEVTYKTNQTFRFGLEAEWILPFNRNRWGIVFEPTFQSFKSDSKPEDGTIDYKSIEFPIGVRYYYHINDQTRFYLNGFYVPGFAMNFNSQIMYIQNTGLEKDFDVKSAGNVAFGGGAQHKRLSVEARYYANRNLLKDHSFLDPGYSRFSIILGYKIFNAKY